MDARAFAGGFDGGAGGIDVLGHAPGEPADDWALDFLGDGLHRLEVAIADDGKTRLDHIDVEPCQLAGDFHFLAQVHAGARALFAVAQRRIKNNYVVRHRMNWLSGGEEKRSRGTTAPAGNAAYAGYERKVSRLGSNPSRRARLRSCLQ